MQPLSLQDWPQLLFIITFTSVLGVGVYAICRKLEPGWDDTPFTALGWLFPLALWGVVQMGFLVVLALLLVNCLPGLLGSGFHLKSGGASRSRAAAILLVSISASINLVLGALMLWFLAGPLFSGRSILLEFIYWGGLLVYPFLAPMAFWAWNSSQVRPGVDEAFEDSRLP